MQDGKVKCLTNVLHVPKIIKNLVFVGQTVSRVCRYNLMQVDVMLNISTKKIG